MMRELIKIEWKIEEETQFLENLNYQIAKIYGFYKNIPNFYKKIDDLESHFDLIEAKRRRDAFKIVMNELEHLILNCKNKS
jgi:SPX domain protein involved in polyphosphate accumulation